MHVCQLVAIEIQLAQVDETLRVQRIERTDLTSGEIQFVHVLPKNEGEGIRDWMPGNGGWRKTKPRAISVLLAVSTCYDFRSLHTNCFLGPLLGTSLNSLLSTQ